MSINNKIRLSDSPFNFFFKFYKNKKLRKSYLKKKNNNRLHHKVVKIIKHSMVHILITNNARGLNLHVI